MCTHGTASRTAGVQSSYSHPPSHIVNTDSFHVPLINPTSPLTPSPVNSGFLWLPGAIQTNLPPHFHKLTERNMMFSRAFRGEDTRKNFTDHLYTVLVQKAMLPPRCLDELSEILECKSGIGQMAVPIFYDIDPSDVRKQTAKEAFKRHRIVQGNELSLI
ncbi:unnamed protein product [Dovyalis caffra]|uniref:ADP-ribosyl cyclase/cyclic ADP-ribose hydrolase n=1 Tax=Dovyalis caffra TaxID=77055 RepID=A0AAV1SU27_9ROSI|nr:unnamed protein product [Dovyalis caffra]